MSRTKWVRGSPLPKDYWIKTNGFQYNMKELLKKLSEHNDFLTATSVYYLIDMHGVARRAMDKVPGDNLPILSYEDCIYAINEPSTGYKVGDWVYVLARSGDCKIGEVRKIYHVKNNTGTPDSIYQLADEGAYWVGEQHIRMATPEEVAKATQSTEGWKVGQKVERLAGDGQGMSQNIPVGTKGTIIELNVKSSRGETARVKWNNGDTYCCLTKNLKVVSSTPLPTESKEWVPKVGEWVVVTKEVGSSNKIGDIRQITGTKQGSLLGEYQTCYNLHEKGADYSNWECVKSLRPATPEEIRKAQSKNGKEWICTSEDGVDIYRGGWVHWIREAVSGWVYDTNGHPYSRNWEDRKGKAQYKMFSTEQAAKEWIAQQTSGRKWNVGDWFKMTGIHQILRVEGNKVYVSLSNGREIEYIISEVDRLYGDKWIPIPAPEEKSTNKSIINSQKPKTKNNEKDRNKAVYVCRDHQIISKPERRTATPVSGGGCTGLIKGTHKVHREAISCQ